MINLTYYGHSCFVLDFDGYKIALDPYNDSVPGFKLNIIEANEVLCSHGHGDHNFVEAVNITKAQRPEIKVTEIQSFHDKVKGAERGENILRIFEYDSLRIMHCGDIGCMPEKDQLEQMRNLDAVLVPVGGKFTIDAKEATEFVNLIGAKQIIPMHYKHGEYGIPVIADLADFTNQFANVEFHKETTIEIKKFEGTKVVVTNFVH